MADTQASAERAFEFLGSTFVNASGEKVPASALQNKIVAIYFSAHWCPPCRAFTPKLVQFYNAVKESNKHFEIIFVSSDQTQQEFDEYFRKMPWLALPFEQGSHRGSLKSKFSVYGIPTLVFLRPDGTLMTSSGRSLVGKDPQGQQYPWPDITPDAWWCTLL